MNNTHLILAIFQSGKEAARLHKQLAKVPRNRVTQIESEGSVKDFLHSKLVKRFRPLLMPGEILLVIEYWGNQSEKIVRLIKNTATEIPVFFQLFRDEKIEAIENRSLLPQQPVNENEFERQIRSLGKSRLPTSSFTVNKNPRFLVQARQSAEKYLELYEQLNDYAQHEENVHLSAEWLLDNAYSIRQNIKDVKRNLPLKFFKELPFFSEGPEQGTPTLYPLITRFVALTDGKITKENILLLLKIYQEQSPLTMRELWAFPLLLKIRLLECLGALVKKIIDRININQEAAFWVSRILIALRKYPEKLDLVLHRISREVPHPTPYFADQLFVHLGDEEMASATLKTWLQRKIGEDLNDILQSEQTKQTYEQTSLANIITSMHRLSLINWRELFEIVNPVDEMLASEAAGIYSTMKFETRDQYRHVVEKLAKKTKQTELFVAEAAVQLTVSETAPLLNHVGYYLVDKGLGQLKEKLEHKSSYTESFCQLLEDHSILFYFSACLLLFSLIFYLTLPYFSVFSSPLYFIAIPLSFVLITSLVTQIVNYAISHTFSPSILPKMSYKEGIPQDKLTLVLIPTLLADIETIEKDLESLEIHFLANRDTNILFGLLTDFKDAEEEVMAEDESLCKLAEEGINELNNKYGHDSFYLFHRPRTKNEAEGIWMGWERKRGKLEELNRFLSGKGNLEELLRVGDVAKLLALRFVLTLDRDTTLPKNSVTTLVETLAHPLNEPILDPISKKIIHGYSIIQPRVSTSYPSAEATWFSHLFSDPSGIDPYSKSVSDVYQDVFKEGVYHGKGIYDFKTFHQILDGKIPSNLVLSHDLLEGAYVRTGFASDIELNDTFPSTYPQYCKRQHRWVRGDWQVIRWLTNTIYNAAGEKQKNPLSFLDRWKIYDNLNRSLIPFAGVVFLTAGWFSSSPLFWCFFALSALLLPCFFQIIDGCWHSLFSKTNTLFEDLKKTLIRTSFQLATLPHQALISLEAIFLALFRQLYSRKKLLQWDNGLSGSDKLLCTLQLNCIAGFSVAAIGFLFFWAPQSALYATPFLLLWGLTPFLCKNLEKEYQQEATKQLLQTSEQHLRLIARKTWRFFDDFTNEASNWLPPDNYQEKLRIEVAYRTSPTNIGLYQMTLIASYRMGYLTPQQFIEKNQHTLESLNRLETYMGHFLNWYDIKNLQALMPKYVSTVDSGNLLASLWTLEKFCSLIPNDPVFVPASFLSAAKDIFLLYRTENAEEEDEFSSHLREWLKKAHRFESMPAHFIEEIFAFNAYLREKSMDDMYWKQKISLLFLNAQTWIETSLPWLRLLNSPTASTVAILHSHGPIWKIEALSAIPTFKQIAERNIPGLLPFFEWVQSLTLDKEETIIQQWTGEFISAVNQCFANAEQFLQKTQRLEEGIKAIESSMDMSFLYSKEKKLFTIGYNVSEHKQDSSFYDLLASEARVASFIAIARGDVSIDHWWSLGRPIGNAFGQAVLLSWGGTMFEYLMPLIWCKSFKNSLLDYACRRAIKAQIDYCQQRDIPWGISESAYSRLDMHNIYQYRSFGVPNLGLKRGLEKDWVITPYSSALALMVYPKEAFLNLKRLKNERMYSDYGFFEAIDYSREDRLGGERGVLIHAYMAHHMGMTLCSIFNLLSHGYLQDVFHSHPSVKSTESLLYEKPFLESDGANVGGKDINYTPLQKLPSTENFSHFHTPHTYMPVTHLLSNGSYSVMLTNSGGGYSKYKNIDITRWQPDVTCDSEGSFFYIRDVERNLISAPSYHPLGSTGASYLVNFSNHKAEIKKKEHGIELTMEVLVSPEDNAEIRCLTLRNLTMKKRVLEITSYYEIALAEHRADQAHPAFSKMFVKTEAVDHLQGLLANRRKRSSEENEKWCFQIASSEEGSESPFQFETDREIFIGRGKTLKNPAALSKNLSQSAGFVLDPIFSIRKKITLDPAQKIRVSYVTGYAASREEALKQMDKFRFFETTLRTIDMAWTYGELYLRRLHMTQEDAKLFQRLANLLIYPDNHLRASLERLRRNQLSQVSLWAYGISGDSPILIATISNINELEVIRKVLAAHAFWNTKGLKTDLVILNEEHGSYEMPLKDQLMRLVQNCRQFFESEQGTGIYQIETHLLSWEEKNLLLCSAEAIIVCKRGAINQQLTIPWHEALASHNHLQTKFDKEEPSAPLPFLELDYFNGLGGFTKDGKEYAVYLQEGRLPPRPWINVIANQNFGFLAAETGVGLCWSGNSQMNRLTPWSNDYVLNKISDVCYVRDDESGKFWTITAFPITEKDHYRVRHGHGYSIYEHNSHAINQEMIAFCPINGNLSNIKIQILKLTNQSTRKRILSVFPYADLVLGANAEETKKYILTTWSEELSALLAVNHFRTTFSDRTLFLSASHTASYTSCRNSFIGRNNSLSAPAALKLSQLPKITGSCADPCLSLQSAVELQPGETAEIVILLGETNHPLKIKEMIHHYQQLEAAKSAFQETKNWWGGFLSKIELQTPDKSLNTLFNHWLIYQVLACRLWARTAFYQSGGAYGFRDQLQDTCAILYFDKEITRNHILLCASRQFLEGDVQHWWHPDTNQGVRTRISDDLLWLPYTVLRYLKVTGDDSIMNERVSYLEGRELQEGEHEAFVPTTCTEEKGTIKEHCIKAIDRSLNIGVHGLPLIGGGDWNDGMNAVGAKGKGESVWLAWFLMHILQKFSPWLRLNQEEQKAAEYENTRQRLHEAIEKNAWDGEWYLRAFFDDGEPLGSHQNEEDKIDSIPQAWAVIAGETSARAQMAMESVEKHLIDKTNKLALLLTPPFDKTESNPGYIKGYPPGVRENGGQYSHAAMWVAKAYFLLGKAEQGLEILHMANPINRSTTPEEVKKYKVEPYALSADIYCLENFMGCGGWTWYTGSANVMYRVILENLVGFTLQGDTLVVNPTIPSDWNGFTLTYRLEAATYLIVVENPQHVTKGIKSITLDGKEQAGPSILLSKEPADHKVVIVMG